MSNKIRPLRSLIFGKYDSEAEFARELGWSKQRLNKITNGLKEPSVTEINALANGLETTADNLVQIFLAR